MFKKGKNEKSTFESFDSWAQKNPNQARKTQSPRENNKNSKDNRPTVWRRFGGNKDIKEIFPRPEAKNSRNTKQRNPQMDEHSHEGKVNSRGSISGSGVMGAEGTSGSNYTGVNPDLRRRLKEKKQAEAEAKREMDRVNRLENERDKKIAAQKEALKKKQQLRQAMITAEIIGPPKAKKFS